MWQLLYSDTTKLLVYGDPAHYLLVNEYGRHLWISSQNKWQSPRDEREMLNFELILGERNDEYHPVNKLTALVVCGIHDANAEQIGRYAPVA